jgi:hypothetical protein
MRSVSTTIVLVFAAFLLGSAAGYRLHREPLPRTVHEVAARLCERGAPVRVVSQTPRGNGFPVLYLTSTDLRPDDLATLRYGDWARWTGTVYFTRDEGPGRTLSPVTFREDRHHYLRLGNLIFWGDPELLHRIAETLR